MKRILVTGGAGLIGSHLCEYLLNEGHYVTCLDNFLTGSRKNIEHLYEYDRFLEIVANIEDSPLAYYDEIYNLACPASPKHYQKDPIKTIKTTVLGMLNILDNAVTSDTKLLQASTSEVYGDPTEHPQKEAYFGYVNPNGIRSCYDEGKRCAETILMDYHRMYGVNIKIARIFNTYGPRMAIDDGRVVSNFIVQALKGDYITIYGNGSQTRSFQYVDDLIQGLVKLMDTPNDFTGPVNIGNPGEFTMIELAEKIIELTGSKSSIVYCSLPADDPKQRRPDISLAKEKLGWQPKVPLEEGLIKTIEYFQKNLH